MSITPEDITNKDLYALMQSILSKNIEIQGEIKQNKDTLTEELAEIKHELSNNIKQLKKENECLKTEINDLKNKIDLLEQKTKKYCFVVYGLEEREDKLEDIQSFLKICNDNINISCSSSDFRDIYRIGHFTAGKVRPLKVEVISYHLKQEIQKNAPKLKGTGIYIAHDYTDTQYTRRKVLSKYLKLAKDKNLKARIQGNYLYIEQERYTIDDLANGIPSKVTEENGNIAKGSNNKVSRIEKDKIEEGTGTKKKQPEEGYKTKRSTRLNSNK